MRGIVDEGQQAMKRPGALALFALLAGSLLSMIDSSVVNVAIPDIARELHGSLHAVQWTVSGYLLALGAALPASAYLGKRFGTIHVYGASLAAFTLASVACAFAQNVPELVACRAVQGLAAAPLVPMSMNLLFGQAGAGERDFPVSAGVVFFLGPALGPTIGGILVSTWSWPAIFLVNAPIGAAALLALPSLRRGGFNDELDRAARFDPVGLTLLSAGLVLVLYGTSEGPQHGWWSAWSVPFWCVGLLLLVGYVRWARRAHPAVDLRLLRQARSALAIWLCLLTSVALFGVLFLIPVLVQNIQRHGALAAGLVLLPQGIVMGVSAKVGASLSLRALRPTILAGLAAVAATTALLLLTTVDTPLWITALITAGRGLGIGLVFQPLLRAMLNGLPPAELADANTLFNVSQRLGGSVGVNLLVTVFTLRAARHGSLAGLHDTLAIATGVALFGIVCALFLRAPAGEPADPVAVAEPEPAG